MNREEMKPEYEGEGAVRGKYFGRIFGSAAGKLRVGEDFDADLELTEVPARIAYPGSRIDNAKIAIDLCHTLEFSAREARAALEELKDYIESALATVQENEEEEDGDGTPDAG